MYIFANKSIQAGEAQSEKKNNQYLAQDYLTVEIYF